MRLDFTHSKLALLVLLVALFTGCASHEEKQAEDASLAIALQWLSYLDNGSTDELWSTASQLAKDRADKDLTIKYWTGIRKGFGKLEKRDLQLNFVVEPYTFQGSIPDGLYRRIVFWSKYESRELVKEELWMSFENGKWQLLQYVVK